MAKVRWEKIGWTIALIVGMGFYESIIALIIPGWQIPRIAGFVIFWMGVYYIWRTQKYPKVGGKI